MNRSINRELLHETLIAHTADVGYRCDCGSAVLSEVGYADHVLDMYDEAEAELEDV